MDTRKSNKGTVTVTTTNGVLRIRLPRSICDGRLIFLYVGKEDSILKRKAQTIALKIEQDIEIGNFDSTLERYKDEIKQFKSPNLVPHIKIKSLKLIWESYANFRKQFVSPGYYQNHYVELIPRLISKLPSSDINKSIEIRDYLVSTFTPTMTKRYLVQFNAACKWAKKSKIVDNNPFEGLTTDIKSKSYNWKNVDAFSEVERDFIIDAYASHSTYFEYLNFVKFLFFTGCRLGEAVALRWVNVSIDNSEIYFCESWCRRSGRKPTKTEVNRKFPCNDKLREFLQSLRLRSTSQQPNDFVFPSPTGNEIKTSTFVRTWKGNWSHGKFNMGIVTNLVQQGLVARYRTPYHTRHSFISWCLKRGVSVQQVARWVGNSPEIIYKHYAACVDESSVPNF